MDWKEICRKPVPYSVRLYPGLNGPESAYALAKYKIKEYRYNVASGRPEWNTHTEDTSLLRLADHPDLESDFRLGLLVLGKIERACFFYDTRDLPELELPPSSTMELHLANEKLRETRNIARSFWKSLLAHDPRAREDYATWVHRCPWLDDEYEEDQA